MTELAVTLVLQVTLEPYLYCVVGAEMYPDWPDIGYWGDEALKTQAIAARSYAMFRLQHPRSPYFTMYGDARDQAYDCNRQHPRATQAVKDTAGMIVVTDDPDFIAQYVNKCGQSFCPFCKGKSGHNEQTWTGRLCQFGVGVLAKQGLAYEEILQFYYGGDAEVRMYDE